MGILGRLLLRKRMLRRNPISENNFKELNGNTDESKPVEKAVQFESRNFSFHLSRYVGQTVTFFVAAGGASGAGFTGVLIGVSDLYVRLLSRVGPPPACSLGNSCFLPYAPWPVCKPFYHGVGPEVFNGYFNTMGSITYLSVEKITAFVHNAM